MKKSLEGEFLDPAKDHTVRRNYCVGMHLIEKQRSNIEGGFG